MPQFLEREDAHDALAGSKLGDLRRGARVGTSSGRRAAQLRHLRPDIAIEPIRGNVDTRLRKLSEGQFDAIVLAAAGMKRLGSEMDIAEILTAGQICPAAGQGALAIQTRSGDAAEEICRALNHQDSYLAVDAERTILAGLGGGCQLPVGAFAEKTHGQWAITAVVMSPDGSQVLREEATTERSPVGLAAGIIDRLIRRGARGILAQSK